MKPAVRPSVLIIALVLLSGCQSAVVAPQPMASFAPGLSNFYASGHTYELRGRFEFEADGPADVREGARAAFSFYSHPHFVRTRESNSNDCALAFGLNGRHKAMVIVDRRPRATDRAGLEAWLCDLPPVSGANATEAIADVSQRILAGESPSSAVRMGGDARLQGHPDQVSFLSLHLQTPSEGLLVGRLTVDGQIRRFPPQPTPWYFRGKAGD